MKCGNPSREPGNGVTFVLGVDPASSCEGSDQSSVSSFPLRQVCLFFSESEEHKALIESVLEEGARFEGELVEKRSPAARLG